jgi:hypothetical protein
MTSPTHPPPPLDVQTMVRSVKHQPSIAPYMVHLRRKINALNDMHDDRSRAELVADIFDKTTQRNREGVKVSRAPDFFIDDPLFLGFDDIADLMYSDVDIHSWVEFLAALVPFYMARVNTGAVLDGDIVSIFALSDGARVVYSLLRTPFVATTDTIARPLGTFDHHDADHYAIEDIHKFVISLTGPSGHMAVHNAKGEYQHANAILFLPNGNDVDVCVFEPHHTMVQGALRNQLVMLMDKVKAHNRWDYKGDTKIRRIEYFTGWQPRGYASQTANNCVVNCLFWLCSVLCNANAAGPLTLAVVRSVHNATVETMCDDSSMGSMYQFMVSLLLRVWSGGEFDSDRSTSQHSDTEYLAT